MAVIGITEVAKILGVSEATARRRLVTWSENRHLHTCTCTPPEEPPAGWIVRKIGKTWVVEIP